MVDPDHTLTEKVRGIPYAHASNYLLTKEIEMTDRKWFSSIMCLFALFIASAAQAHIALEDGSTLYLDYNCVRAIGAPDKYPAQVRLLSGEEDLLPHFLEFSGNIAQLQLLKAKGVKGSITLVPQQKSMLGDFAVLLPHENPELATVIAGPRSQLETVYHCTLAH